MANSSSSLDGAFQALSDPTRRAVIRRLAHGPAAVKELAEPFDMGLPSFMKHIKVLESSGLIQSKKVGRVRTCQIDAENLAKAESWLAAQRELWEGRAQRLAQYVERELAEEES